jgi:hypothetical protein
LGVTRKGARPDCHSWLHGNICHLRKEHSLPSIGKDTIEADSLFRVRSILVHTTSSQTFGCVQFTTPNCDREQAEGTPCSTLRHEHRRNNVFPYSFLTSSHRPRPGHCYDPAPPRPVHHLPRTSDVVLCSRGKSQLRSSSCGPSSAVKSFWPGRNRVANASDVEIPTSSKSILSWIRVNRRHARRTRWLTGRLGTPKPSFSPPDSLRVRTQRQWKSCGITVSHGSRARTFGERHEIGTRT